VPIYGVNRQHGRVAPVGTRNAIYGGASAPDRARAIQTPTSGAATGLVTTCSERPAQALKSPLSPRPALTGTQNANPPHRTLPYRQLTPLTRKKKKKKKKKKLIRLHSINLPLVNSGILLGEFIVAVR